MKVLALVSSYRWKGNTAQMVGLLEAQLRERAAHQGVPLEFEAVNLARQEIQMCRGCRVCFNKGEELCPLKDDLLAIKEKVVTADALILASPVYVDDVNGVMKNWIDRMAFVCHRPEFAGKVAFTVVTSGASPARHATRTLNAALQSWGFHIVGNAGFKTGAYMRQRAIAEKYEAEIEKVANKLYAVVTGKRYHNPTFLALMTFRIQQIGWRKAARKDTPDYDYWHANGWLNQKAEYFFPPRASRIKVGAARLVGSMLAGIFT